MHTTTPAPHTPTPPATAKHNNTPRLRFAEFQEAVPTHPLSGIAEIVNEKIRVEAISSSSYVSTENLLPEFAGMAATGNLPPVISVTRFQPKDILISNIRPYLKKVWQADIHGGASNDVLVVRAKSHVDANYLAALLRSDHFIDYVMRGAKGVKMPRGEISMIREFPIPCPSDAEQQKIAACLTSLDTLITAQTQKLDTLKTHKKGLMQQLFPRAGETTPRLRFAEFRGEWGQEKLAELITTITPPAKLQTSDYLAQGSFPIIDQSQEAICGWTNDADAVVNESLPLIVFGDHTCAIKFVNEPFAQGADGIKIIKAKTTIAIEYLFQSINHNPLTMGDYKRHFSDLKERAVFFPDIKSGEQQKIAACLSSLDELITAQAQKVAALQTHKKGLMQQLFPAQAKASA